MFSKLFTKRPAADLLRIDYDDRLLQKNGVITVSLNGSDGHRTNMTVDVVILGMAVAGATIGSIVTGHPLTAVMFALAGGLSIASLLLTIWYRVPRVIGAERVLTFTNKADAMAFVEAQVKGFVKVGK